MAPSAIRAIHSRRSAGASWTASRMTGRSDALQLGVGLITLERGQSWAGECGHQPTASRRKAEDVMKVLIVGGVAGGASCAARLRRLDEEAEIVMVERGPYVSYANCGLPYHVGGVIEHEADLLVASEELFRTHFGVDCRTGCEAIGVSAADKTVQLRDVATGEVDHRVVRHAGAFARGGLHPAAPARHRPPWHLPREDRAGCGGDPPLDRARHELPRRDGEVLGLPDGSSAHAGGHRRRRLHRP